MTTATAGGSVTYTIVVSNAGPNAASGASAADAFPAACASVSYTSVAAGGAGGNTAAGSGNINDTLNLPSGSSVTYTASCTLSGSATGTLVNTATVTAPVGVADPSPGNNSATDTDVVGLQADLSLSKTDGVTTATAGSSVTYTIVVSNAGPSAATGASAADTFPAACASVSYTSVVAGGATGNTAAGSGNINDTLNLPSGSSVTYTATCTLSGSATGTLDNTATVTAPVGVVDPNPANNSATDSDTITPSSPTGASVSGTKTAAGTFTVGGTITYTVILTNSGPGVQADNPGNEFTDTLPATLALVSASATSGVASTAGNTVNWNGALAAAGGTVTITINATILPSAAGTTVSNQGTISYDADGNGTNESTAQTDNDPGTPGTGPTNVQITGGPTSPVEIPTLSSIGLLLLMVMMAGLALAMLRRRRVR